MLVTQHASTTRRRHQTKRLRKLHTPTRRTTTRSHHRRQVRLPRMQRATKPTHATSTNPRRQRLPRVPARQNGPTRSPTRRKQHLPTQHVPTLRTKHAPRCVHPQIRHHPATVPSLPGTRRVGTTLPSQNLREKTLHASTCPGRQSHARRLQTRRRGLRNTTTTRPHTRTTRTNAPTTTLPTLSHKRTTIVIRFLGRFYPVLVTCWFRIAGFGFLVPVSSTCRLLVSDCWCPFLSIFGFGFLVFPIFGFGFMVIFGVPVFKFYPAAAHGGGGKRRYIDP